MMCQKGGQVFKQFYALVLTTPMSVPRSLQVFKYPPTQYQIDTTIVQTVVGFKEPELELEPGTEKPLVYVVPIHIPLDILYQ